MQNTLDNICVTVTHTQHLNADIYSTINGASYESLQCIKNQKLNFFKFINLLKDTEIQYKIQ